MQDPYSSQPSAAQDPSSQQVTWTVRWPEQGSGSRWAAEVESSQPPRVEGSSTCEAVDLGGGWWRLSGTIPADGTGAALTVHTAQSG